MLEKFAAAGYFPFFGVCSISWFPGTVMIGTDDASGESRRPDESHRGPKAFTLSVRLRAMSQS